MRVSDIRDYIETLGLADIVYSSKMPVDGTPRMIGVYNSKHPYPYKPAIGTQMSYGILHVTILIHWTRDPDETEEQTDRVFKALTEAREAEVNGKTIKFILPEYEAMDVGTDPNGIFERVIEAAIYYKKEA